MRSHDTPDNIRLGSPPHSLLVLLTRPLEALERLTSSTCQSRKTAVQTLGVSVLNDKPAAAGEFGLDRNEGVLLCEDDEEKITVELDEIAMTVLLRRVLPSIPLQKTTTKTEDEAEEDDPRLCGLSLIDFARTTRAWTGS
ncbi:hypothetical protein F5J12DRAFT_912493 [Pisolithus orientalis]|uniref:uncharacterized protein n=1 Tax=Pisolithus orientalis TaxID=936130 RepID=UPI0022251C49|nr:uncharacterized protein F5J12DRAFT_912493 [Pisolithus orientalis]KAI6009636.1 hypothetical protein F5J12DRAFT_912493 [Pisolithus orientalis]